MSAGLDSARAVAIAQVAHQLGLTIGRDGKSFGPCPCCDRERRSSPDREKQRRIDRRQPCIIRRNDAGHEYWQHVTNGGKGCADGHGDGIALVAMVKCGRRWLKGDKAVEREVLAFFDGASTSSGPGFRQARLHPSSLAADLTRLPPAEVAAFLHCTCLPVVDVPEVAAYLARRGLSPMTIAERQLGFALPRGREVPDWAKCGGLAWWQTGHQLIVPMFGPGPDGTLAPMGVRARAVRNSGDRPKSLAPCGKSSRGLVFAAGPHWLSDLDDRRLITIAEGEIDTLTLQQAPAARRGAVLGCIAGSACREIAALIPKNCTVVLASHADPGGEAIARAWQRVLAPNVLKLRRIAFERLGCAKTHPDPAADRVEDLRPLAAEQRP